MNESQALLPQNHSQVDVGSPDENHANNNNDPRRSAVITVAIGILWTSMLGFGAFALFQYILPSLVEGNWKRWDVTDDGLYRATGNANYVMVSHLMCGVILQLLGPIQLIPSIRRKYIELHRILGRIYIGAALGASGLATTYVCLYSTARRWIHEDIGNIIFGLAAFSSACMSLYYIKKKDIENHKVWSIRLFLTIFGATVFRVATVPYFLATIFGAIPYSQAIVNSFFYIIVIPSWLGYELVRHGYWNFLGGTKTILAASTYWGILTLIVFVGAWLPAMLKLPSLQTGLFDDDNDE